MRRRFAVLAAAVLLVAATPGVPAGAAGPPDGAGPPQGFPVTLPTVVSGTATIQIWPQVLYCPATLECGFTATVRFNVRSRPDGSVTGTFDWYENGDSSAVYSWDVQDLPLDAWFDGTRTSVRFWVVYQPTDGALLDDVLRDLADTHGTSLEAGDPVMVWPFDSSTVDDPYPDAVAGTYTDVSVISTAGGADWFEGVTDDCDDDGGNARCRFHLDADDIYLIGGVSTSRQAFADALSVGDRVTVTYDPDGVSQFDLIADYSGLEGRPDPIFGLFIPWMTNWISYSWEWTGNIQVTDLGG